VYNNHEQKYWQRNAWLFSWKFINLAWLLIPAGGFILETCFSYMALDFIFSMRDEKNCSRFKDNELINRLERSADEVEMQDNVETRKLIKDIDEKNLSQEQYKIIDLMFHLKFIYHYSRK
jgi:hypothetical protein